MPRLGFEPMIPAFERAKTVHALHRPATVMGYENYRVWKCYALRVLETCLFKRVFHDNKKKKMSRNTHLRAILPCGLGIPDEKKKIQWSVWIIKHQAMKEQGGTEMHTYAFLIWHLDKYEVSLSPAALSTGKLGGPWSRSENLEWEPQFSRWSCSWSSRYTGWRSLQTLYSYCPWSHKPKVRCDVQK
jgi:hypothetical protein